MKRCEGPSSISVGDQKGNSQKGESEGNGDGNISGGEFSSKE